MGTYDFVDVINADAKCGWQVKATKDSTPVTWKRAKIPNREALIEASLRSPKGMKALGKSIIDFCNSHALRSLQTYNLEQIGYARLIVFNTGKITYFERVLCTKAEPLLFNADDFIWRWSTPKITTSKEQLPALHGIHRQTNEKWWAWHGRGENQLHFSGERHWWPSADGSNIISFQVPASKMGLDAFVTLLEEAAERI